MRFTYWHRKYISWVNGIERQSMGFSNKILGLWNIATMVLSFVIIGAGIWLVFEHNSVCIRFVQWPVIILGVIVLVISILGFVGSCWRVSCFLWIYVAVMFLLILFLIVFTIFVFVVTNKGAGQALAGKGFKSFRLGNYKTWLQRQVNKTSNWNKIQSCLNDVNVCNHLEDHYTTDVLKFKAAKPSPLKSGCCEPPTSCGFTFINATQWDTSSGSAKGSDCKAWSNAPKLLCFNCNSCMAGVLQTIKKGSPIFELILIGTLVVLIVVYTAGCCALRNARRSRAYGHSGYGRRGSCV